MIAAEEFTFPVISSNAAAAVNLALLPPLWRISDSEQGTTAGRQRRPFSIPVIKSDGEGSEAEAEAEAELQEKMDLLWEDFNEELQSSAESSDSGFSEETNQYHNNNSNSNSNNCGRDEFEGLGLEECANVRQLNLIRAKPKKMKSVVKVMKKLFSMQMTARSNQQKISTN